MASVHPALVPAALVAGLGIGISLQLANPQAPLLQANQYMQNSAEYRAACLQTYSWAEAMLRYRIRSHNAAKERSHENRQAAIVMDLDETVFDNAGFQAYLDRHSLAYSEELWKKWEMTPGEVRLVPGAKALIQAAQDQGVAVCFITNRWESGRAGTLEALRMNGLPTDSLMLRGEGQSSDKSARRKQAEDKYSVLMYFGDNLRDFSETFVAPKVDGADVKALQAANAARSALVDQSAHRFGSDWVILPNPVYGEFDKLKGNDPRATLRETSFKP